MELLNIKILCLLAYIFSLILSVTGNITPELDKELTTITNSRNCQENISQENLELIIKSNSPIGSELEKKKAKSLNKPLEEANADIKILDSGEHIISAYAPEFEPVKKFSSSYIYPDPGKISRIKDQDNQNLQSAWLFPAGQRIPQIIAVECSRTSIPRKAKLVELNPLLLNPVHEQHVANTLGMKIDYMAKNSDERNGPDIVRSSELKETFARSSETGDKNSGPPIRSGRSSGSDYINPGITQMENPTFESRTLEDLNESSFPPLPTNPGLINEPQMVDSTEINEGEKSQDPSGKTGHGYASGKNDQSVKIRGKYSRDDAITFEEQKSWKNVLQQAALVQPQSHKGKNHQKTKGSDSDSSIKSIWPISAVNSNKNVKGFEGGSEMLMKYPHSWKTLSQQSSSKDNFSHLIYAKTNILKEKGKDTLHLDIKNFGRSTESSLDAGAQSRNFRIPSKKKLYNLEDIEISRSKDINQHVETDQTIGLDVQEKRNKGKLLPPVNEWITPKKTLKYTEISNVDFYPSSIEVVGPDVHPRSSESPQPPIEIIQGSKNIARHSKNKKKAKGKGKQKVKAVPDDDNDDDWDIKTLDLKSGAPAEVKDKEHENFIKYVHKMLQNYFVAINDLKDARTSLFTVDQPTPRIILEDFFSINNHTPLLKLELKSQAFDKLYECEKMNPSLYNGHYWTFKIDHTLKKLDGVDDDERMRRKGAFLVQYFQRREGKLFEEQENSLSVKLRNLANVLKFRNPFEVFVKETDKQMKTIWDVVNSIDDSEFEKLKEVFFQDYLYTRFRMVEIRQVELRNSCSEGFFGEEFLQNVMKQGLQVDSIRLLEVSLELSTPTVSWKELSADDIQIKYMQVLSALAGAPCARQEILKYCPSEAELYSRNRHWVGSQTQKLLLSDSRLYDHVIKRIKLLLSALKGKEARTLHEIAGEEYVADSAHRNELLFYDEAFAAFLIGLPLADVAWIKYYQRSLKSCPSFKGRHHKNGVYWPKAAAKAVLEFQAFKSYYQLLGKILMLEK